MLDLEALIAEMHGLADHVVESARQTVRQRDEALAQLQVARSMAGLRQAVQDFGQEMALPADGRDMGATYPAPPAGDYTVLATDGSQVAPDYHHVAPWYVLNAGCAVFRYGIPDRERCRLTSHPRLRPPARPGTTGSDDGPEADALAAAAALSGRVEFERLEAELLLAIDLLDCEADEKRSVLLLDGPLVQWRMLHDVRQPDARAALLDLFRRLLGRARESGTPVAGFISRSRAVEWITLLRFSLCPEVAASGQPCADCRTSLLQRNTDPRAGSHHAPLAGLRDVELAAKLLTSAGDRTEVLELQSRIWREIAGTDGAAGFFYLNTGSEIARVEAPSWVWEDEALMTRLHAVLVDQCAVGNGYPMALAEAHEAAVVRAADRDAFYHVIERILNERDFHASALSAKAQSKRRPMA